MSGCSLGAGAKTTQEIVANLRSTPLFLVLEEKYFWPLDTAKRQDAHSRKLGIRTRYWHPYDDRKLYTGRTWGAHNPPADPPTKPLKDQSLLEPWNIYYDQLVSEKEDLFDRWITESMRDMGLDPDNLTEDENA